MNTKVKRFQLKLQSCFLLTIFDIICDFVATSVTFYWDADIGDNDLFPTLASLRGSLSILSMSISVMFLADPTNHSSGKNFQFQISTPITLRA